MKKKNLTFKDVYQLPLKVSYFCPKNIRKK